MRRWPAEWKDRVGDLRVVDWSKRNREWENVCMVANSVVSNRQARLATKAHLKRKLGLPLSEAEERSVVRPGGNEPESLNREPRAPGGNGVRSFPAIEPVPFPSRSSGDLGNRMRRPIKRPVEMRISTVPLKVTISNQIPVLVADWILAKGTALPRIQNFLHEADSGFPQSAETKRLTNGWYIEVGDSQEVLIQKGRRLLDACGFRDLPLSVLLEDGSTKTA